VDWGYGFHTQNYIFCQPILCVLFLAMDLTIKFVNHDSSLVQQRHSCIGMMLGHASNGQDKPMLGFIERQECGTSVVVSKSMSLSMTHKKVRTSQW